MYIFVCLMSFLYMMLTASFIQRKDKKIIFSTYNIFVLLDILVYGLLFPLSYVLTMNGYSTQSFINYYSTLNELDILVYYIIVSIITYPMLFIFKRKKINSNINKLIEQDDELNNSEDSKILFVAIAMLLIGVICDFLYLKAYGGYSNYLNYARALRSGVSIVDNKFSFLIAFRGCISFSSYLFLSLSSNKKYKIFSIILFCISFILSIRVMYSNFGRMAFIIYFLIIIVYSFLSKKKIKYINLGFFIKCITLLILFGIGIIIVGNLLDRNSTDSFIAQINKEISFIFVDFILYKDNMSFENFRYFVDLFLFPIYLLPSSIWSSKLHIQAASDYMTKIEAGAYKGTNGVYGEMPIDLISISLMQFGYIGMVVLPIVYALYFNKLCKLINKMKTNKIHLMLSTYTLFTIGVETLFYADPRHIMGRCFPLIVFEIIYSFCKKIKIKEDGM